MPNLLNQQLQAIQTTKTRYKQMLSQTTDKKLQKNLEEKIEELTTIELELIED